MAASDKLRIERLRPSLLALADNTMPSDSLACIKSSSDNDPLPWVSMVATMLAVPAGKPSAAALVAKCKLTSMIGSSVNGVNAIPLAGGIFLILALFGGLFYLFKIEQLGRNYFDRFTKRINKCQSKPVIDITNVST